MTVYYLHDVDLVSTRKKWTDLMESGSSLEPLIWVCEKELIDLTNPNDSFLYDEIYEYHAILAGMGFWKAIGKPGGYFQLAAENREYIQEAVWEDLIRHNEKEMAPYLKLDIF